MQEIIRRLIEDEPETARGILEVPEEKLTLTVDPGERIEESFLIRSANGRPIEGFVRVDDPRFRLLVPEFLGTEEEIGFVCRTEGLSGGEKTEGHFSIISDGGEASVTVVVSVRTPYPVIRDESGEEEMKNLFHFANLARRDFDAATRLFYSGRRMRQLFHGADRKYASIYRGLSGTDEQAPDKGASVEEFLIAIRKKDPMEYTTDRPDIRLESLTEDAEEILRITKRGWGYTWLEVETDGPFLDVRKEVLTERDFLGNVCSLSVVIRYERLHEGKNFGSVTLYNGSMRKTVPVIVSRGDDIRPGLKSDRKEKQALEAQLVRSYVNYRMKKQPAREWLIATGNLIARMNTLAPDDVRFQLYTAHYLITASKESEAIWVLDRIRNSVEVTCSYGETMRAYFLYLETLLSREEKKIEAVEEILAAMHARNPEDWRIAWLLQFLFDDRALGNGRRLKIYEEQFAMGCRSPILYLEAIELFARDPSLLKKVDDCSLYVLTFAARHQAIPKALVDRVVWLLQREKHGSTRIYKILAECCRIAPDSGAVDAICALLIKDARTDEEAFRWYALGVEKDSRITRLYEFYMSSFPAPVEGAEVPEIPREVLLYFSYKSELPYDKNALLYRYVVAHRQEEQDLYRTYLPQMERFVSEQMAKGRIDPSLSTLYGHFCKLQPQDPTSAERFFEAMHMRELRVDDPAIRRVVVIYDRLRAERVFPVVNGSARFPLYGKEAAVLLEDVRGHRHVRSRRGKGGIEGEGEPVFRTKSELSKAENEVTPLLREGNANVNLYLTEAGRMSINADNVDRYRRLVESDALTPECRGEISRALLRFYYDNDFIRQLADYLPLSHPEQMSVRERAEVLEMAVLSGIYDQAFALVERFGFAGAEEKTIYRLASRTIARGEFPETPEATMLAWKAFCMGKYDEGILGVLVRRFEGLIKDAQTLFKACNSFSVEALPLVERMITQLLFTGGHADNEKKLFSEMSRGGGSTELQVAYLARCGRESLYQDTVMDAALVDRIRTFALCGEKLPSACRLAYLKYYASDATLTSDPDVTEFCLSTLSERETGMPFLYAYRNRLPALALTEGMRYVQIGGAAGGEMTIYLKRSLDGGYAPRRMKEPYPGIYTHGEVIFPGESIRYFVTVRTEDADRLLTSGMLEYDLSEDAPEGETRYALTSRIIRAKTQNDRALLKDTLLALYRNDYLNRKLFPLPGDE